MASLPALSTKPDYADTQNGILRVPFPGEGMAGWQMAAMMVAFTLFLGWMPWLAGLITIFIPALFGALRSQSAPKLELDKDKLSVTVSGRLVRLVREEVSGARVVREGRAWALELQTTQGTLLLERTGVSPADLQWAASVVEAWKADAPQAPPLGNSMVEQGLGATTFVVSRRWSAADLAVAFYIAALGVMSFVTLSVVSDLSLLASLVTVPLAALLGHLVGERRSARTEVQVRDQAVLVRSIGGREEQRTIALEDVLAVEQQLHTVLLTLREEKLRLPAKDCAIEMAEVIEQHRQRLLQAVPVQDDARARMAELARMKARVTTS